MLEKPQFDCNDIGDFYDCGCEEHEGEGSEIEKGEPRSKSQSTDSSEGHEGNTSPPVEISKEPSVSFHLSSRYARMLTNSRITQG